MARRATRGAACCRGVVTDSGRPPDPEHGGAPDAALAAWLERIGVASAQDPARWTPLSGGVASDIWRVDTRTRTVCVKRALAKLRVAADWFAPVERNAFEWHWLAFAATVAPGAVPGLVARDDAIGAFAMQWLPPDRYPVWKPRLLAGHADADTAARVARTLVRLHAASAGRGELADRFPTTAFFRDLRLDPYLGECARVHPDLAPALDRLVERTAAARIALVHGDVSPKNLLIGPHGPVFLDAECAWYGDPAFDIAFLLNHLLLKAFARPAVALAFDACYRVAAAAWCEGVDWEDRAEAERRAAELLSALLLARVDGKSPVEYLEEPARDRVRAIGRALVARPPVRLGEVLARVQASRASA